jgi:hypothetical protein
MENKKIKIYTPENTPIVKRKVDKANEMLKTVDLPKFKFIIEK